ncbi:MAG TPA: aminopeptidase P family protein [Thermohalobaculum sp.]|nr:aminopeptidase P family protein [Thermohalobaculum sp.]
MFQTFARTADSASSQERVAALRDALARAGVQGFVVPRADAHQGETVAPRDERLAWLTGFTGSAGLAVVLPDRAALFVDGRYTLQAGEQVDSAVFTVVPTDQTKPEDWLAEAPAEGTRIGYDPWLHGRTGIRRLAEGAAKAGAELVPVEANPIDAIWEDQPGPPMGAVEVRPDALAGEPSARKRGRVAERVRKAGGDALVLTLPDTIAWLLNIRGGDLARSPVALGFALMDGQGRVRLFMERDKFDGQVLEHLGGDVEVVEPAGFGPALDRLGGRKVVLDERACPLWVAARLEAAGAQPVWAEDPVSALKTVKNAAELAGTRAAHRRDGAAMVRFLAWLDGEIARGAELTEIDVVKALERFRGATGELRDIAFDTICGSGPNGAIVHYRVTRESNRTLCPGELLLLDSGGQYVDGTTDITRTLPVGAVPDALRRPFTLVLKGLIALATARWPKGTRGRALDPLARQHLWRAGLNYDHGTGHGVGVYLNVHEGPVSLSHRGATPLEPGMILSIEPGCYREGAFGIRIENLAAVTPAEVPEGGEREMLGFETLTLCPIDRRLIDPALLTAEERAWLDAYHARVRETLTPELDAGQAAWLDGATRPLAED